MENKIKWQRFHWPDCLKLLISRPVLSRFFFKYFDVCFFENTHFSIFCKIRAIRHVNWNLPYIFIPTNRYMYNLYFNVTTKPIVNVDESFVNGYNSIRNVSPVKYKYEIGLFVISRTPHFHIYIYVSAIEVLENFVNRKHDDNDQNFVYILRTFEIILSYNRMVFVFGTNAINLKSARATWKVIRFSVPRSP